MVVPKRHRQPPEPTPLEREFREYLNGKSVVIVGPAASLTGRGQGELIDSHDVVVRINLALPIPEDRAEDIGSRTDVLYHVLYSQNHFRDLGRKHTEEEIEGWRAAGLRYLVTRHEATNERVRAIRPLIGDFPMLHVNIELIRQIRQHIRSVPNTGAVAIAHLLSLPIRSLYVTGFDFYETGYYAGYGGFTEEQARRGGGEGHGYAAWGQTSRSRVVHRQGEQKEWFRQLYKQDRRLEFDEVASRLLGVEERLPGITALVPMKGNSERVPGKNLRKLAGKPLLYWTLAALHEASRIERVVVDTDSEEIAAAVRQYHPATVILERPEHLRDGNRVTGNDLIAWEMSQVEGEHFGQFHVTSPLITAETIDRLVGRYYADLDRHDSLMTVTEHHFWLFRADGTPLNSDTRKLVRSQDLEPLYEDNNAGHLFSRASFAATGSRIGETAQMVTIPKLEAIDIDWPEDFLLAEAVMRMRHG